jgi:putative transposase
MPTGQIKDYRMIESLSPYVHYYNRGVNKENIFFTPENYIYLIRLIDKFRDRYKVDLLAYCLMPNHYHILLKHDESIEGSRFIQRTFNSYTQSINKMYSRVGTLFQGNVKKRIIENDDYLIETIAYIHMNPVRKGLCNHPIEWPYSDFCEWVGIRASSRNIMETCIELFGDTEEYTNRVDILIENL